MHAGDHNRHGLVGLKVQTEASLTDDLGFSLKALNTAIELRNEIRKFSKHLKLDTPLELHIGINTGIVLAGIVGGGGKQEYTVMGDTVNLASRLEDAARTGQILAGPDTYRETKDFFDFQTLKPIMIKGKAI